MGGRIISSDTTASTPTDSYSGTAWNNIGATILFHYKDFPSGGAGTITWDSILSPGAGAYWIGEAILDAGYAWQSNSSGGQHQDTGDRSAYTPASAWTPVVPGDNRLAFAQVKQRCGGGGGFGACPVGASPGTPTGDTYSGGLAGTGLSEATSPSQENHPFYSWYAVDDTSQDLVFPAIDYPAPETWSTTDGYDLFIARLSVLPSTLSWDFLPDGRRVVASCADTALKVLRYSDAVPPALESTLTGESSGIMQVSLQVRPSGVIDVVYLSGAVVKLRSIIEWSSGLPAAVTIATGYNACSHFLDERAGMMVVTIFDSATSTWKYVVGALNAAGDAWSWSSVQTLVASATGSGQVRRERDGRWTFVYVTSAFAVAGLSCRNLQPDGTGTWS